MGGGLFAFFIMHINALRLYNEWHLCFLKLTHIVYHNTEKRNFNETYGMNHKIHLDKKAEYVKDTALNTTTH